MDPDDFDPADVQYAAEASSGLRTWYEHQDAEEGAEPTAKERSASFVLYSGGEVRSGPWQYGGDLIEVESFQLKNFKKNPVVLDGHDMDAVIGRGTAEIEVKNGTARLVGEVVWDWHESNPRAILVAGQHARGVRSAVSIGFMPGKGSLPRTELPEDHAAHLDPAAAPKRTWFAGSFYRKAELYEWSSVSVPRDPGALKRRQQLEQYAAEAEGLDDRIRRVVGEILDARGAEVVLRACRHDDKVKAAIAALALASLPTDNETPAASADWFEEWT